MCIRLRNRLNGGDELELSFAAGKIRKQEGVEMFRPYRRLSILLLPVLVAALNTFAVSALAQKSIRKNVVFAPLTLSLTAASAVVSGCPDNISASKVQLNARANSPGGHPVRYRWSTSAGRIDGDGPTVSWDLSGLQPGYYKAFVTAATGNGADECEAFSSIPVLVSRCAPPPRVCPNVSVSCPDNLLLNKPLTFTANVTGILAGSTPTYYWTVSSGRIIEGQGTSSITVDTTGAAGQSVTATISIGGYNLDCSASCSVPIPLPVPPAKKFDEFPNIARNDEKARLDNFAVGLQNDPTATGYVIVYPSRRGQTGDVQKHTTRIIDYLVNSRGIDARRIVTLVGPMRDDLRVELWIAPQGASPPTPAP